MQRRLVVAGAAAGLLFGGAIGLAVGVVGSAGAQTNPGTAPTVTAPTSPPTTAAGATPGGSNEDPTHEATESPEREAQENSGTFHHRGHGGSNEDPAHEATESPEREAQEDSGTGASGGSSTAPAPATPSTVAPNPSGV